VVAQGNWLEVVQKLIEQATYMEVAGHGGIWFVQVKIRNLK